MVRVKPNLAQLGKQSSQNVVRDLKTLAKLAETFTNLRSASMEEEAARFIERLDFEGG